MSALLALSGCASAPTQEPTRIRVAATTPILTDMVRVIAGDDAHVDGLIPAQADPHTYEPSLRAVRNIANADVVFTNGLLLEPQSMVSAIDAASSTPPVAVAEDIVLHGGELIPLVENVSLDTPWLGIRADGDRGLPPTTLTAEQMSGPGAASAYVTGTFGAPEMFFAEEKPGSMTLPTGAHTHMSWAFTEPGRYVLRFTAPGFTPLDLDVVVGVDPHGAMDATQTTTIITEGHVDVRANYATGAIDVEHEGESVDKAVIAVPATSVDTIPGDPAFRFIGKPGSEAYVLPQAVAGKHMHGEIDPHVWQSAPNAQAMVDVIAERLIAIDPAHATGYTDRATAYKEAIAGADARMQEAVAAVPQENRHLITSHEGYAYLADRYGLTLSGIVSPNEDIEPSATGLAALSRAIQDLQAPAVFVEPVAERRPTHLTTLAHDHGVRVCRLYGDAFAPPVTTYLELMDANATAIRTCLAKENS